MRTLLSWRRKTTAGKRRVSNMVDSENIVLSSTVSFEQRFNCLICWAPKLRMIYGSCQHRLCESCLYDKQGIRRSGLARCPTCQKEDAFPETRPDIPEDNIEIQFQLGVRKCPNSRCKLQLWHWEVPDHLQDCLYTKPKKRKSLDDSSCVMTLRSHAKKQAELASEKATGSRIETRSAGYKNLRPRRERSKTYTK